MFNLPLSPHPNAAAHPKSPSPSSTQLESLVQRMLSAINGHDFSPTSPAWSCCATDAFAYAQVAFTSTNTPQRLSLPEYLHLFETLVTTHPGYRGQELRVVDLSSVVEEEEEEEEEKGGQQGSVFANLEWWGGEGGNGLVKPTVGTWEFRRAAAAAAGVRWVCVRVQVVPGISPGTGM